MKKFKVSKGIILAGGLGTRLYPMTSISSKQLQNVYDKPLIYYPLCTLMLGGIKDILLISTPRDLPHYEELLGNGSLWGINISYAVQEKPDGIAQAFMIGEEFIDNQNVCLILGDNLFFGYFNFFRDSLEKAQGATVFGYYVKNPSRYGVLEFDQDGNAIEITEKPKNPMSNYAVTGLYIYDKNVVDYVKQLEPSTRGELEITDINKMYLERGLLNVEVIGRGVAWLDTGTPDSLLDAANFISTMEKRQGLKFGCPEEVALRMGMIDDEKFVTVIKKMPFCSYRKYLQRIHDEQIKTWEVAKK